MSKKDYYELLGVEKSASEAEIKKAYYKMARQCHPDNNRGDKAKEEEFKEVLEAYEILSNKDKRTAYDQCGHNSFSNGGGNAGFSQGFGSAADLHDIFNDLFGGGFGGGSSRKKRSAEARASNARGSDLRFDLQIRLEDAFSGLKAPIHYVTNVKCKACNGNGSEGTVRSVQCSTCGGAGRIRAQQGFFTIERTCHVCNGEGESIQNKCKKCGGHGRVRDEVDILVSVPKGIEDGYSIRVSEKGEAGVRGGNGDLYVYIRLSAHRFFTRNGADIYCRVPVRMTLATLGGEIEVPSIDGIYVKVKVPAGTQTGDKLRLKEKGMPYMNSVSKFGDMYIQVTVETPINLTDKQKELLKKFECECNNSSSPQCESFFKKVKSFFK